MSGHGLPFFILDCHRFWFWIGNLLDLVGFLLVDEMVRVVQFEYIGSFFATYIGLSPLPGIVTARMFTFVVGARTKPSFATISGKGDNPTCVIEKL